MADFSTATIFLLDSLLCVDWRDRYATQFSELKYSIYIYVVCNNHYFLLQEVDCIASKET